MSKSDFFFFFLFCEFPFTKRRIILSNILLKISTNFGPSYLSCVTKMVTWYQQDAGSKPLENSETDLVLGIHYSDHTTVTARLVISLAGSRAKSVKPKGMSINLLLLFPPSFMSCKLEMEIRSSYSANKNTFF